MNMPITAMAHKITQVITNTYGLCSACVYGIPKSQHIMITVQLLKGSVVSMIEEIGMYTRNYVCCAVGTSE